MRRTIGALALGLGALATAPAGAADEAPLVVASIKPIHSLVAGVMAGVAEPILLIEGVGSPHGYSLRPSQARALSDASVVFWVGPNLEAFLVKPLASLAGEAVLVELAEAPGLVRLPTREAGVRARDEEHAGRRLDQGDAHEGGEADEHRGHVQGATDMHLWLDPGNAEAMTAAIVEALSAADPANAAQYRANGAVLRERLRSLDRMLEATLEPVRDRPFVVFHDAYQYLEARYRLNAVGAVAVDPQRRPSARRLRDLREEIRRFDAACVFSEPQFAPALVTTIVEGTGARSAELDPLGATLEAGPEHYFQLMGGLRDALVGCLGPATSG